MNAVRQQWEALGIVIPEAWRTMPEYAFLFDEALATKGVPAPCAKGGVEAQADVLVNAIAAPLVAKIRALEARVAALEQTK